MTLHAARTRLSRPGVTLDPHRQWPTAMKALGVPLTGRIAAEHMADPGRAIARLTDLGFGPRLREVLAMDRVDGPVPDDLLKAAIKVLAAWGWDQRPAAIVSVGSRGRPRLVRSIAEELARVGKLPYFGAVEHVGPSSRGRSNSAQRLRAIHGTFKMPNEMKTALPGAADKPILLVDDMVDSGWTITLVAYLLREAGAGPIYPFVLGIAR
jgi:ATP-dependent DNA helicase RecQ